MRDLALEIDDAVILILGAPTQVQNLRNRLEGITRLEKLIFLFERETSLAALLTDSADFTAYNYGPFSAKIYQEIETLSAAGLLIDSASPSNDISDSWERIAEIDTVQEIPSGDPYVVRHFTLTARGQRYYEIIAAQLPSDALEELTKFKNSFAQKPLQDLIRYVYNSYPEYTERSLIRDQVLALPQGSKRPR